MAFGAFTAVISVKLRILSLLAGILTMIALYSVNILVESCRRDLISPMTGKSSYPARMSVLFLSIVGLRSSDACSWAQRN